MPVVNAPFRLYWAYNLSFVNTNLQPPFVAEPFAVSEYGTYQRAFFEVYHCGQSTIPFDERRLDIPLLDRATF